MIIKLLQQICLHLHGIRRRIALVLIVTRSVCMYVCMYVCVCMCVGVCVRACVRACENHVFLRVADVAMQILLYRVIFHRNNRVASKKQNPRCPSNLILDARNGVDCVYSRVLKP